MAADDRVGLSTYLFYAARLDRDHLARIRDAGFRQIEIVATRPHVDYHDAAAVDTVRGWLDDLGLRAWSVHLPTRESVGGTALSIATPDPGAWQQALDEMTTAIAAAGRIGARLVVLHLGRADDRRTPAGANDIRAVGRALAPLTAACTTAGVTLAIETIPNALSTATAVAEWLERDDEDLAGTGACLDVGHVHRTGSVIDAVDRLAGHIFTTHLHDTRGASDDHLVPFAGTIDWTATLLALTKVGYAGPLILEVADHGDTARTLAAAATARDRIRAILDTIEAPFPVDE